ncbi:unnamed protein product [Amoebophrya sp. A120]|nr:unnamed protein product [Amoebophrya sp. A120]|eukprot:GSA120T00024029001.1
MNEGKVETSAAVGDAVSAEQDMKRQEARKLVTKALLLGGHLPNDEDATSYYLGYAGRGAESALTFDECEEDLAQRERLATRALELDANCIPAYGVLAGVEYHRDNLVPAMLSVSEAIRRYIDGRGTADARMREELSRIGDLVWSIYHDARDEAQLLAALGCLKERILVVTAEESARNKNLLCRVSSLQRLFATRLCIRRRAGFDRDALFDAVALQVCSLRESSFYRYGASNAAELETEIRNRLRLAANVRACEDEVREDGDVEQVCSSSRSSLYVTDMRTFRGYNSFAMEVCRSDVRLLGVGRNRPEAQTIVATFFKHYFMRCPWLAFFFLRQKDDHTQDARVDENYWKLSLMYATGVDVFNFKLDREGHELWEQLGPKLSDDIVMEDSPIAMKAQYPQPLELRMEDIRDMRSPYSQAAVSAYLKQGPMFIRYRQFPGKRGRMVILCTADSTLVPKKAREARQALTQKEDELLVYVFEHAHLVVHHAGVSLVRGLGQLKLFGAADACEGWLLLRYSDIEDLPRLWFFQQYNRMRQKEGLPDPRVSPNSEGVERISCSPLARETSRSPRLKSDKSYPCPDCGSTFYEKDKLKRHRKNCEQRMVVCTECGESFAACDLANHDREECAYGLTSCKDCGAEMKRMHLEDHLQKTCTERTVSCGQVNSDGSRACKWTGRFCELAGHRLDCAFTTEPCSCCLLEVPRCDLQAARHRCPTVDATDTCKICRETFGTLYAGSSSTEPVLPVIPLLGAKRLCTCRDWNYCVSCFRSSLRNFAGDTMPCMFCRQLCDEATLVPLHLVSGLAVKSSLSTQMSLRGSGPAFAELNSQAMLLPRRGATIGSVHWVSPLHVRFTHDSIKLCFGEYMDKRTGLQHTDQSILDSLEQQLRSVAEDGPAGLDCLDVCWARPLHGEKLEADALFLAGTGNRRLCMWRMLAIMRPENFALIKVRIVSKDSTKVRFPEKCTTSCAGRWVEIRTKGRVRFFVGSQEHADGKWNPADPHCKGDPGIKWPDAEKIFSRYVADPRSGPASQPPLAETSNMGKIAGA